jgi:hypothetical protein
MLFNKQSGYTATQTPGSVSAALLMGKEATQDPNISVQAMLAAANGKPTDYQMLAIQARGAEVKIGVRMDTAPVAMEGAKKMGSQVVNATKAFGNALAAKTPNVKTSQTLGQATKGRNTNAARKAAAKRPGQTR